MTAVEHGWYNAVLPGSRAMATLEESSALPVYEAAADLIDTSQPVMDLGCGTGRFAELLRRRGVTKYVGIDFAADVVAEARRYCTAEGFVFGVWDLRDWQVFPDTYTIVLLEVLEHLDDDHGLLARLPSGSDIVLSVPDFWSESHVRVFPNAIDAVMRYDDLICFERHQTLSFHGSDNHIHVLKGRVR